MGRYLARKLATFPLVMLGVSFVIFVALRFVPGDPARLIAGKEATQEAVEAMRQRLGLDQSIPTQYARFLSRAVRGDLGDSIRSRTPVIDEIGARLPATAGLTVASLGLAVAIGGIAGILAGVFQHSWIDHGVMLFAIIGASTPNFWIALMLMSLFAVQLGWLPLMGTGTYLHYVLPSISLALYPTAMIARMTRSTMLEVIRQDYVRTARAKGLRDVVVFGKHAFRNALVPVVTLVGLQLGVTLGGAVVTETVFAWPGLGRLLIDAVRYRDYPLIQGTILATIFFVVMANTVADVLIAWINPRVRFE